VPDIAGNTRWLWRTLQSHSRHFPLPAGHQDHLARDPERGGTTRVRRCGSSNRGARRATVLQPAFSKFLLPVELRWPSLPVLRGVSWLPLARRPEDDLGVKWNRLYSLVLLLQELRERERAVIAGQIPTTRYQSAGTGRARQILPQACSWTEPKLSVFAWQNFLWCRAGLLHTQRRSWPGERSWHHTVGRNAQSWEKYLAAICQRS